LLVKAGKVAWDWWNTTEVVKVINTTELINYAKGKNVGVILWVTWKAVINKTTLTITVAKGGGWLAKITRQL
jgi:hypothetical protein